MPIVLPGSPSADAVTLARIEAEVARRTGPYSELTVTAGSTNARVYVEELQSTVDQGGNTGLYILRRGLMSDGTAVPGFVTTDRQRMVADWNVTLGYLTVDRDYAASTITGEVVELIALNPTRILRPAVLRGLSRCFFEDRATVSTTTAAAERDLTASAFWLTRREQVLGVARLPVGSLYQPSPVDWWKPLYSAGSLWLAASPDPSPDPLYVTALRPHSSWVNGADSTTGPAADADVLDVNLDYAATAAHQYIWETNPELLHPLTTRGRKGADDVQRGWAKWVNRLPKPPDRFQTLSPYPEWEPA